MKTSTKNLVVTAAKIAVASILIGWLVRSGVLDFRKLLIFVDKPLLLAADLALFATSVLMTTLRWRILLTLAGAHLPLGRAIQLQMTAVFFNVVIPGNVGGDLVKALYVAREAGADKRTTIFLIAFVERLLGLGALVLVASLVGLVHGETLWRNPQTHKLVLLVGLLGIGTLVGPAAIIVLIRRRGDRPMPQWLDGTSGVAGILRRVFESVRLVSASPKKLAQALVYSMLAHLATIAFFTVLTREITEQAVSFSAVATVFPLGILTMLVPISPAGLGVGHVAFDRLFAMIGLTGGATVFNVYLIGFLAPCLLGVVPYIMLKRTGQLPTETSGAP